MPCPDYCIGLSVLTFKKMPGITERKASTKIAYERASLNLVSKTRFIEIGIQANYERRS